MLLPVYRILLSGAVVLSITGLVYASGHGWSFGHGAASAFNNRAMGSGASSATAPRGGATSPGAGRGNGPRFGSQFSRGAAAMGRSNSAFGAETSKLKGGNRSGTASTTNPSGTRDGDSAGDHQQGKPTVTGTARALQQQQLNNERILQHREAQAQRLRDISQRNGNQHLLDTADRMQKNAQTNYDRRASRLTNFPNSTASASTGSTGASSGGTSGTSTSGAAGTTSTSP
ncbi:MAG: hypothetical protein ACM3U2_01600 [Deltaproteobacteria bacterium]